MHEEIQKKLKKKKAGTNNLNRHIASIHRLISLSVCLPTSHSAKFFIPTPNSHAKRRWYGPSSRGKCSFQICLAAWILLCFSDADHVTKLCVVAQVRIKERPSSPWTSFSHPYMFTAFPLHDQGELTTEIQRSKTTTTPT